MSFLSCIGKKSKRRRSKRNEPLEKLEEGGKKHVETESIASTGKDEIDGLITKSTRKSDTENAVEAPDTSEQILALETENKRVQAELVKAQTDVKKTEEVLRGKVKEIHRLEDYTLELKSKMTNSDAECAKLRLENQRLSERVASLEEKQAEVSRLELQKMIDQMEEVEKSSKTSNGRKSKEKKKSGKSVEDGGKSKESSVKSAESGGKSRELSGIRTNPVDTRKKTLTQEDKQISFRLSKTEARLSQSEDENKQLREDLKEMLDTHTELQRQMVEKEDGPDFMALSNGPVCRMPGRGSSSGSDTSLESTGSERVDALLRRLEKAEREQAKVVQDYKDLQQSYTGLQTRLGAAEEKSSRLESSRQADSQLGERLSEQECVHSKLAKEMKMLDAIITSLSSRMDTLNTDNNRFKSKNENLTKQGRNQKNEIDKLQSDVMNLREENVKLLEESKKLSQQLQKRKDVSKNPKIETLQKELAQLRQEHDVTLNRLSEVTTTAVLKQNSKICSLDDVTCSPGHLAERFRHELYAEDWGHAFTVLSERMRKDEKRAIQILLEICTESYLFCKRASRYQLDTVSSVLISPTGNHYRSGQFAKKNNTAKVNFDKVPDDLKKQLSHFRLNPSKDHIDSFTQDFLSQIDYDRTRFLRNLGERDLGEIKPYARKCVELCWRMVVQETPMYLLFKLKHGVDVDVRKFDKYTVNASRVDFVVWPAVFLEEGGTCLQKGVVQPLPERP